MIGHIGEQGLEGMDLDQARETLSSIGMCDPYAFLMQRGWSRIRPVIVKMEPPVKNFDEEFSNMSPKTVENFKNTPEPETNKGEK